MSSLLPVLIRTKPRRNQTINRWIIHPYTFTPNMQIIRWMVLKWKIFTKLRMYSIFRHSATSLCLLIYSNFFLPSWYIFFLYSCWMVCCLNNIVQNTFMLLMKNSGCLYSSPTKRRKNSGMCQAYNKRGRMVVVVFKLVIIL